MTRALEQLIVKWREESARHPQRNSGPEHAWGEAHDKCADELEAALALPGEPIDNGNIFVFCDVVRRGMGCVRGAGHNGPHALSLPPHPQGPVLLEIDAALPGGRESKEEQHG